MIPTSTIIVWANRADGSPLAGAEITATLDHVGEAVSAFVSREPIVDTTNDYGYLEMSLWANTDDSTYNLSGVDNTTGIELFNESGVVVAPIDQTINDLLAGNGNEIPTVEFTLDEEFDVVTYELTVTATASDPDGTIVAYMWAINGETVGTSQTLVYTLTDPGVYSIRAVVTDDDGAMRSTAHQLTLYAYTPELAAATEAVSLAETTTLQSDVDAAQVLVTALPASEVKDDLQARLDAIIVNSVPATEAVELAEAQPTPETQSDAQVLVTGLQTSAVKDDLQTRLDALDAEVANVVAARLLVDAAEIYPWTALKQSTAQSAVDALVSTVEQAVLSARLDALDDQVAAETAVSMAETTRSQEDVDTAQALVDVLPASEQVLLQARLDAIYIYARLTFVDVVTGDWEDRPPHSPYLSPTGLLARSPGYEMTPNFSIGDELTAGSGWYVAYINYLEMDFETGVAIGPTAEALDYLDLGSSTTTLAIIGSDLWWDGAPQGFNTEGEFVLAINYGVNPIIYLLSADGTVLNTTATLATTGPISTICRARFKSQEHDDWMVNINPGNDLVNNPMPAAVEATLTAAGADMTGFVLGWGGSFSGEVAAEATIGISGISGSPAVGIPENLTITCTDSDLVDRSAECYWYVDDFNWNDATPDFTGVGATFSMTPPQLGHYQVRAVYYDPQGRAVTATETVFADGAVVQPAATEFSALNSNSNIADLSANEVRFGTAVPFKLAAIGNWGMWGEFRYFEMTLNGSLGDQQLGFGVTTLLNGDVMWGGRPDGNDPTDGAGSISVVNAEFDVPYNLIVWLNGANSAGRGTEVGYESDNSFSAGDTLGVAVDFRDKTGIPILYYISANHTTPATSQVAQAYALKLTHSPVYPMVYCNQASSLAPGSYDVTLNGGAVPFVLDPVAALTAQGVDTTDFELGWLDSEVTP